VIKNQIRNLFFIKIFVGWLSYFPYTRWFKLAGAQPILEKKQHLINWGFEEVMVYL
jgi:hypothetical protein